MLMTRVKRGNAPVFGHHYRITRKDERLLRGFNQFQQLETRKDGVRFTDIKLKKLSTELLDVNRKYDQQQSVIVQKAIEVASGYTAVLESLSQVISELDVLIGFAKAATNASEPYTRPEIVVHMEDEETQNQDQSDKQGICQFTFARHPCVERMQGVSFIANDIILDKQDKYTQIITGPNMGKIDRLIDTCLQTEK